MNNEIKEIIEHIQTYPEKMYCLSEKEKIIILDYITNLQQENKYLRINWNQLKDFINRECFYDEDTLSYEELMTEINLIEYGSDKE